MTHFTSMLCFKMPFLMNGGQTGTANAVREAHSVPICASQNENQRRVCLGWTSPPRSAAADAPFNVQSVRRLPFVKGETEAFLWFFNGSFFICSLNRVRGEFAVEVGEAAFRADAASAGI